MVVILVRADELDRVAGVDDSLERPHQDLIFGCVVVALWGLADEEIGIACGCRAR